MKRILVATDGSETADRAVKYAAHLAKTIGSELVIANVIGGYGMPTELLEKFAAGKDVWINESLAALSAQTLAVARDCARTLGVSTILLESRAGSVAETIVEIAKEKGVDAIVIGKRGASGIGRMLLGSISNKLVSLAPIPIIVVP
jgi:nucleotide-binding universal stress UspA family protein